MHLTAFFIFSLFLTSSLSGGTILETVSDDKYVENGKKYDCVVKICCKIKEESKYVDACGSGVIIDPHWILTAAHIVDGAKDIHAFLNEKKITINKIYVNPDFEFNLGHHDIALCYSKEEIKIPLYPKLYENQDELDKICVIAGYGMTGTALTGASVFDGKKRAGSNKIEYTSKEVLFCTMSKNNHTELEFCAANGDSGGGLFIDNKLAGINSMVLAVDKKTNSDYGDECTHTRISSYKIWIDSLIK